MYITITNSFLVAFFVLLALKWIVTGYFGSTYGQLIFVLSLLLYLYLLIITFFLIKPSKEPVLLEKFTQGQKKKIPGLRYLSIGKWQTVLLPLYLLIISIGLLRSVGIADKFSLLNMTGRIITIITMAIFCYFILKIYANSGLLDRVWTLVTYGLCIYVFMNVVGSVIGLRNPFVENSQLIRDDTLLSFLKYRSSFPFSANHNSFAVEAGLLVVLAFTRLFDSRHSHHHLDVVIVIIAFGALIMTNSRTPYLAFVCVFIVYKFKGKLWMLLTFFGVLLTIPVLFSYVDFLPWLEILPIDLSFMSRKHDLAKIASLNSRGIIWRVIFDQLLATKAIHIIGYGAYGHIASGLSYAYSSGWKNPESISTHNSFVQHIIDFGYIGLFVLIIMIANVFKSHSDNHQRKVRYVLDPPLALIVYIIVCSCTSNILCFYEPLTFFIFLLICIYAIWFSRKNEQKKVSLEM